MMRRPTRVGILTCTIAGMLLVGTRPARAAGTPEEACQKGRYAAAAKYEACEVKAAGALLGGGDLIKFLGAVSRCYLKYGDTWAKLQAKASGTGATCDAARFAVNGGVVTDRLTGLQWEQKTDDATEHDKDNVYSWSAGGDYTAADGTAHTGLLATLNSGGCFAGQCDWRLPTQRELQTILSEGYPCGASPCIDQATFGPTSPTRYWSSGTYATSPSQAWSVNFDNGLVDSDDKNNTRYVRAVRGGL